MLQQLVRSSRARRFNDVLSFLHELNPALTRRAVLAPLANKILRSRIRGKNTVLRSLAIFGDIKIGYWPYDEVVKRIEDHNSIEIPVNLSDNYSTRAFYYGTIGSVSHVFVFAFAERDNVPKFACAQLGNLVEPAVTQHSGFAFDGIEERLTKRRWTSLKSQQVEGLSDLLWFAPLLHSFSSLFFSLSGSGAFAADDGKCRAVLDAVSKESALSSIVGKLVKR